MKGKLTTQEYWDKQYQQMYRPSRIQPINNLAVAELDKIFRKFLPIDREWRFLEVGCAPGIWMDYFHRTFSYNVEGIEYTNEGFELTKRNLKKLGVPSKVYHQDFFTHTLPRCYNVVFSGGFIEHFEDADGVIRRHMDLLVDGGILLIEIPNLSGWNGTIQKKLNRYIYEKHNTSIMNLEYFKTVAEKFSLEVLYIDYAGKVNLCLFQGGRLVNIVLGVFQKLLTIAYLAFGGKVPFKDSGNISPYIVAILKVREP